MTGKYSLNPHYREYVRLLVELHLLFARGQSESVEADRVRDQMDEPWKHLDPDEIARVRGISADLYTLESASPIVHPEAAVENGSDQFWHELQGARANEDYPRALKLLREQPQKIDAGQAALLRGIAYERMGEPELAAMFYHEALSRKPSDDSLAILVMIAFEKLGKHDRALTWADRLQASSQQRNPALLTLIANVLRDEAMRTEQPNLLLLQRSADLLQLAIDRMSLISSSGPLDPLRRTLVNAMIEQGVCYWHLKHNQEALIPLNAALNIDSRDDIALTVRGMVRYEDDRPNALNDFVHAIKSGTSLAWPYYYLAFEAHRTSEIKKCIEYAQQAVKRTTDSGLLANLYEWLAISHAELGTSSETVKELFRQALTFWPGHPRIRHNQDVFERKSQQESFDFELAADSSAGENVGRIKLPLGVAA